MQTYFKEEYTRHFIIKEYMSKYIFTFSLCLLLLVSCENAEEYLNEKQSTSSAEAPDRKNDNSNTLASIVAQRIEIPHVDAALQIVPHYVTMPDGRQVLNYTVQWDAEKRHSMWVAFSWDRTTANKDADVKRGDDYKWDADLPDAQVSFEDYRNNGYNRGHLCASDDRMFCQEANDQTFYYTNISPQFPSFNQGIWEKLEKKVRSWGEATLTGKYDTVYVVKGGTINTLLCNYIGIKSDYKTGIPNTDANGYTLRSDGKKGLPVPASYYMALLSVKNGVYHAIAFIVPHSEDLSGTDDLQQYATSIDDLEEFSGIDFFCNLIDEIEAKVEKTFSLRDWSW